MIAHRTRADWKLHTITGLLMMKSLRATILLMPASVKTWLILPIPIENSEYHFPVMERVPLGTTYSAQNCYFFPDFHDGTSAGSDNFYRSLAANSDVGEWWCSSGLHYDDSIAVQMGNCYKRTTDSGLVPSDSNSETWTLYYCRAELESWQ